MGFSMTRWMDGYCTGCKSIESYGCNFKPANKTGSCPCSHCIVKPMCMSACHDWMRFKYSDLVNRCKPEKLKLSSQGRKLYDCT